MVRDQEVGGSNPLAPTKSLKDLQTLNSDIRVRRGSVFGPYSDPDVALVGPYRRVLIYLPSDDFGDLLGSYQEVWRCIRRCAEIWSRTLSCGGLAVARAEAIGSTARDVMGYYMRDSVKHDAAAVSALLAETLLTLR